MFLGSFSYKKASLVTEMYLSNSPKASTPEQKKVAFCFLAFLRDPATPFLAFFLNHKCFQNNLHKPIQFLEYGVTTISTENCFSVTMRMQKLAQTIYSFPVVAFFERSNDFIRAVYLILPLRRTCNSHGNHHQCCCLASCKCQHSLK